MYKSLKKISAVGLVFFSCISSTYAAPAIAGHWQVNSYTQSGGEYAFTQKICLQADNTWYSTTQKSWNGNWLQSGNEVRWYGGLTISVPSPVATFGIVQITQGAAMVGQYSEWTVPGITPSVWNKNFTIIMMYLGAACPGPA